MKYRVFHAVIHRRNDEWIFYAINYTEEQLWQRQVIIKPLEDDLFLFDRKSFSIKVQPK